MSNALLRKIIKQETSQRTGIGEKNSARPLRFRYFYKKTRSGIRFAFNFCRKIVSFDIALKANSNASRQFHALHFIAPRL
jgi:hypothetical protein